jgi:ABC-type antimicrobial peptide transport system ATPase subunit
MLEIIKLGKKYNVVHTVDNVSFNLKNGEIKGYLGQTGQENPSPPRSSIRKKSNRSWSYWAPLPIHNMNTLILHLFLLMISKGE